MLKEKKRVHLIEQVSLGAVFVFIFLSIVGVYTSFMGTFERETPLFSGIVFLGILGLVLSLSRIYYYFNGYKEISSPKIKLLLILLFVILLSTILVLAYLVIQDKEGEKITQTVLVSVSNGSIEETSLLDTKSEPSYCLFSNNLEASSTGGDMEFILYGIDEQKKESHKKSIFLASESTSSLTYTFCLPKGTNDFDLMLESENEIYDIILMKYDDWEILGHIRYPIPSWM